MFNLTPLSKMFPNDQLHMIIDINAPDIQTPSSSFKRPDASHIFTFKSMLVAAKAVVRCFDLVGLDWDTMQELAVFTMDAFSMYKMNTEKIVFPSFCSSCVFIDHTPSLKVTNLN